MKKRLFPLLIALSALAVSGSAAFYSVFGLSKLFAGASFEVIIMAGSLEFAKLVVASLLYQYWGTINKILKGYLMVACFILMVITSGGIYGFLSGAYQSTATQSELLDKSLAILEQKQVRFEETKEDLIIEKTQLNQSISDLRVSLSNPQQVSWFDKNSQTVITSTSSSARRALQSELKTTITDRDNINIKIEAVMDSINKTDMALLDKEVSNEAESELGPLKYLAETTGYPMNEVVNWFLLLIIFVFDPLAIALVISANMAFAQIRKKEPEVVMSVPEGLKFNTPYPIEDKATTEWDKWKEVQNTLNYPTEEKQKEFTDEQIKDMSTQAGIMEREMGMPITPTELDLKAMEKYLKTLGSVQDDEKVVTTKDIPTHDPQTGELNPHYEELTGVKNPIKEEKVYPGPSDELKKRVKENQEKLKKEVGVEEVEEDYFGDLERMTDTTQTLIVENLKEEDTEESIDEIVENEEKRLNSKNDDVSLDNGKKVLTYRKRK